MYLLEQIKKKAEKDKDVIAVLAFGSYLSKKHYRDIDICLFVKNFSNIAISKKKLAYQQLSSKLDVQVFQQLPLYVRMEVLKRNKPIIIKDNELLFNITRNTIRDFDFFERHYNAYLEHVKHGYKEKAAV